VICVPTGDGVGGEAVSVAPVQAAKAGVEMLK
jgi:hypothetical protein